MKSENKTYLVLSANKNSNLFCVDTYKITKILECQKFGGGA